MIITDSRCKHVPKCYRNNSSEMGQWLPKHFHIITPVVAVIHLEFICSGRLTLGQMLRNLGPSRRVTAAGSRVCGAAKAFLHDKRQIFTALLKSFFTMKASSKTKKKCWKLHVTSKTHHWTRCRQGEPDGFIITTANFL